MRLAFTLLLAALPFLTHGQIPLSLQDRAFITSTSPLRNGLAGYWRLEESSGTRYDFSPNGNHLTSNNSVGQAAGVSAYTGNAASFATASNQYLSLTNASLKLTTNFSFTTWTKLNIKTANQIQVRKNEVGDREYSVLYLTASDRFVFQVATNSTTLDSVTANNFGSVSTNVWCFIAATYTATTKTIAISVNDGTPDTLVIAGIRGGGTSPFVLGGTSTGGVLDGYVDEPGIWNRVLTSAEITQLYNAGLGTHFPWAHP